MKNLVLGRCDKSLAKQPAVSHVYHIDGVAEKLNGRLYTCKIFRVKFQITSFRVQCRFGQGLRCNGKFLHVSLLRVCMYFQGWRTPWSVDWWFHGVPSEHWIQEFASVADCSAWLQDQGPYTLRPLGSIHWVVVVGEDYLVQSEHPAIHRNGMAHLYGQCHSLKY